ncbi:NAD(P)/FAD-dependent oxidoreductase [Chelativorans sp. M5D2P16]|uniref:NAD(P)/FAD-dependent oxidoreductase n=1 Tax=Chelativorans sp. M5D2P16 TaxID=3095678 RepID=UPI002ACA4200|nr:NAD(P)/FAD-dependent oxidoreductase [Chelativorans sp. M5D2P16]MDZ5699748.1 NAD(P)/FAD-dependent oxidoreductase [Chelativorans sp. M5D2P16]
MNISGTTEIETGRRRLAELEARVRRDLDYLCLPPANWVPSRKHEGEHVHDIVLIGGGMVGLVGYFALWSGGMRNMRILDRSPAGREGPWLNYARMETLRSPKQLTGPAYGHASLTFRAWFTAQYGEAAWEALDKIPRPMWMDYLVWYRKVLDIPVENEVEVTQVAPEGPYLRLELAGRGAREESILTRKFVMATGREGLGRPNIPAFVKTLPRHAWAHSSDDIDFAALKGKRVVVIGVGASAVDNAAEALEAGAREVRHVIRRKEMPTINKMMGIGSFGFTAGYAQLPDEWRWRFMQYSFVTQTPAPRGSTLRVSRHDNAYFHFGQGIARMAHEDGEVVIETTAGKRLKTDFVILGTGFTVDPLARTELGEAAAEIMLWRDRYTPPPGEESEELGNFPYLGPDFSFRERTPGRAPWLSNVYCFNYGASASLGKVSGDIPGISEGASWLAREIAATLYREDVEIHWQGMLDYSKPELQGDEWTESEIEDETQAASAPACTEGS